VSSSSHCRVDPKDSTRGVVGCRSDPAIEARAPTLRSLGLRKRCPKIQDVYLGEDFTVYGSGVTCRSQSP